MECQRTMCVTRSFSLPVVYFFEIDPATRNEVRKIEIYQDGTIAFASLEVEVGTFVSDPVPPADDLPDSDDLLFSDRISKDEFEQIWANATDPTKKFRSLDEDRPSESIKDRKEKGDRLIGRQIN